MISKRKGKHLFNNLGLSEPKLYSGLVYKITKITSSKTDVSVNFKCIRIRCKKIKVMYNNDVIRHTAHVVMMTLFLPTSTVRRLGQRFTTSVVKLGPSLSN